MANDPAIPPGGGKAPPNGITLEQHAAITAEIAEGTWKQADIFERHRISENEWNDASQYWLMEMARDAQEKGIDADLAIIYSDVFSRAQDALRPLPAMTPEEWAALTVEVQQQGPPEPLARRNLSTADYLRLARHFAKVLSSDPLSERRFFQAYEALQPKPDEG